MKRTTGNPLDVVVVDIETTGTDPRADRITEIGAVRIEGGRAVGSFETLTDPRVHVPPFITELTGLADEDVHGKPSNSEAVAAFEEFRRGLPLVAHNAEFDLSFLSVQGCPVPPDSGIDTSLLSRLAWPRLEGFSLAVLSSFVHTHNRRPHRALPDAEATAQVYLQALHSLSGLSTLEWERAYHLAQGVAPGLALVLRFIKNDDARAAVAEAVLRADLRAEMLVDMNPVIGRPGRAREAHGGFDVERCARSLSSGGELALALGERYEPRDVQVEMTRAVAHAFADDEVLLVEAGTGVGKSLAYLAPAAHFARATGERVIVSTRTKALQEQLLSKDVPLLADALQFELRAVLLKGRSNYLCKLKYSRLVDGPVGELSRAERLALIPLVRWAEETKSGDASECGAFSHRAAPGLWSRVCAERGFCTGRDCEHFDSCFLFRARRAAENAHIVIVNHSLLLANTATDDGVLGPAKRVVIDEAHHLEDVAADVLATSIEWWPTSSACDRLALTRRNRRVGLIRDVLIEAESAAPAGTAVALAETADSASSAVEALRRDAQSFFGALTEHLNLRLHDDDYGVMRLLPGDPLFESLSGHADSYTAALASTSSRVASLVELAHERCREKDALSERVLELRSRLGDVEEIRRSLEAVWGADRDDWVYWAEKPREGRIDSVLVGVPLDVGGILRERLWSGVYAGVLTSATLTVGGNFDFIAHRLGLDDSPVLVARAFGSPFPFDRLVRCAVAAFLPKPDARGFRQEVDDALAAIAEAAEVNTLVLTTSRSSVRQAGSLLKTRLKPSGRLVMAQGVDGPAGTLAERLRRSRGAVLVGTDTLWEGVDLPGEGVELVVILRLPFAVPTDPLVQARAERLEAEGGNGFTGLSLPEAVLKFRQGFGRLVRTATDRGAVVVLDSRMATQVYGRWFAESIPVKPRMHASLDALIDDVAEWLRPAP